MKKNIFKNKINKCRWKIKKRRKKSRKQNKTSNCYIQQCGIHLHLNLSSSNPLLLHLSVLFLYLYLFITQTLTLHNIIFFLLQSLSLHVYISCIHTQFKISGFFYLLLIKVLQESLFITTAKKGTCFYYLIKIFFFAVEFC